MIPHDPRPANIQHQLRNVRRLVLWFFALSTVLLAGLLAFVPIDERVWATGRVRAAHDTRLFAPEDGILKSAEVAEGGHVAKGDPVIRLDDTQHRAELQQIEASLEKARSDLEVQKARLERTAKLPLPKEFWHLQEEIGVTRERTRQSAVEYDRALQLEKRGLISQQETERARLAVEITRADEMKAQEKAQIIEKGYESSILEEAHTEIQAAQAAVRALEIERQLRLESIERCILRAPEEGIVTLLNKRRPGERVQRGEDLVHLAHGGATRVDIFAGENQFHRVRPGQRVLMKSKAFDTLRHGYIEGRVTQVGIEPESNNEDGDGGNPGYRIVATIEHTPLELTIGSTVEARIILQRIPLWKLTLPENLR